MRSTQLFNHNWLFNPAKLDHSSPDSSFEEITLPHTNKIFPHHNFSDEEYKFISTYRKRFRLPEPLNGRRLYIDFDGAMIASTVSINGHTFEEYRGGYTPFSFDITDYVNESGDNLLSVYVDSTERKDIPPYGYVIDYLLFGGIYRDVHLRYVAPVHIENIFVRAYDVLTDSPRIECDVHIKNPMDKDISVNISGGLQDLQCEPITGVVSANSSDVITLECGATFQFTLWTLDNPQLYDFTVNLTDSSTSTAYDTYSTRFGFRDARFKDDGFYLNGELLQLRGLNRHQTFPYIGAAAPKRLQEKDADIVKYELGCNIVRTSHYPQSPHFLNRCDEIGLLVFEEIPGWQHIGDKDWQNLSLRNVRAMIERDWNHPSIILWGVRINESQDDTEFYLATNKLAHELDPTRQTGGVRYIMESEFLEDVFTFNDFSNGVREPVHTPHMICEFNGHMFPTKSFDNEERSMEHAVRHARIQSQAAAMGGVSGAIGWCAFDYNTHQEFGSGDRICYHGVMDMFRLHKWAGHFYESQQSPDQRVILKVATLWTMGDRSVGPNDPLIVFSNCEEIEVFVGDKSHGRYVPDAKNYPFLPHSPYTVSLSTTDLNLEWGRKYGDLRIVGYIGGEAVAEHCVSAEGIPHALLLKADDEVLNADGMDMTRIVFKITDRYGNRLPYSTQVVTFEIDGPADLIGENPFALVGGQAALYLRTRQEAGTVTIRANTPRLEPAKITIHLK